ncbi:aminotransferase class V-fold PLP-dependent enzyme [Proteinivorax tanatarense]|uniref:Aminotransferase class V-fold PLP-dependent enzyme n=1 Tax=Proteinivorax tanatarense TaxID=1260629 RepID=A0AAU7VNZ0_9FIRM
MIYMDNAATTFPKPEKVYEQMDKFYRQYGVNVGRGQHNLASKASRLVQETRIKLKTLFNCKPEHEVIFTPSATEAINIILQGLTYNYDETIYITHFEHNGVLRTLNHLQEKYNLQIEYIPIDKESLSYDLEEIKYKFQEKRPSKVILNHASNVCGLITPIGEITKLAKAYNAEIIADCAQTAGLLEIDLVADKVDFLIFAGHKTLYGPLGASGFIMERSKALRPLMYGGTGVESANPKLPKKLPDKFEVGSINIHAISGLNAALRFIEETGIQNIRKKEKKLTLKAIETLKKHREIKLYTPDDIENQVGIISFNIPGYSADIIGNFLNENEIAVRTGLQCAPQAHKFLGTDPAGTVRIGLSYFNNLADIEQLDNVLEELLLEI